MQYIRKQETACMSEFSNKIRNQELAITNQIKKYKLNYLTKVIQKNNIDNFIRFSRQLLVLIISYCKNIVYVAPQNLSLTIEELTVLFDDIMKKYHDLFVKYHQKFEEECTQQMKGHHISELCAICGQQMKRVNIDKMRTYILNQIGLKSLQKDDDQQSKLEEDAQFFAQVNNLLTIKQGELLKNQIQINNYKEIALNALTYLTTMKEYFSRESLLMPNSTWLTSAKQEMQVVLKQTFQDKIPPWIGKMLNAFWIHYHREIERKRCQLGVQTDNNIQLQIIQLRKKVIVGKQKLQAEENLVKAQQKELAALKGEKANLDGKIDYYKKQLNKLIEEIENAKTQNQILKMKLNNAKLTQTIEKAETEKQSSQSIRLLSRENIMDSRKTQKIRPKPNQQTTEERILPKIKGKSQSKNSPQLQRTSIKVNMSSSHSNSRLQSKKSKKTIQKGNSDIVLNNILNNTNKSQQNNTSILDTHLNDSLIERQSKIKKNSNHFTDFSLGKSVIQQQFGQLNIQDYKLRIKEVDQHLKSAIKNGIFLKNGQKHFESSILQNVQLKRVPRKTIKIEQLNNTHVQSKNLANYLKRKNNNTLRLSKIYSYLKQAGYLIKISQQDFKDSILKFREANQDTEQKTSCFTQTKRSNFNNKKFILEKGSVLKKSIYEDNNLSQIRYHNDSLQKSFEQVIATNYLMLFMGQQNAYIYQTNSTKNHLACAGSKLDTFQQAMCEQLFVLINQLKIQNVDYYHSLCSFIKFPYQVISNSLGSLNITNNMKYISFRSYFQKILKIHQKCKKNDGICNHIRQFKIKLAEQYENLKIQK